MSQPILPEPPEELKQLSQALCDKLRLEIEASGFIPFSRFMEMALYEPALGYYSAGLHKLGASGDFITAPELGSLFAGCLARQVEEVAATLGTYDILELGAGTGKMAVDLLNQLAPDSQPGRYLILERSADLRNRQQHLIAERVSGWQDRVKWLTQPPQEPWQGVLLANEVIDSLAVERFRLGANGIEQVCVGHNENGFTWRFRPADSELEWMVRRLDLGRDTPFVSELNMHLREWLSTVLGTMKQGLALFIDYGYPRSEFYRPARSEGTLICHYRHHVHDNVFFWPGLQDITAFIDFTALAEAGDSCGFTVSGYTSQAMFLLGCGLDRILTGRIAASKDEGLRVNAEARQLTMPGNMGERFQVMALTRALDIPLRGFSLRDLRHRL